MKFHSLTDKAVIFYNKFRLVYIIILGNWVELEKKKNRKKLSKKIKRSNHKKWFGISSIICVVSLVVKKQLCTSEKSTWFRNWF